MNKYTECYNKYEGDTNYKLEEELYNKFYVYVKENYNKEYYIKVCNLYRDKTINNIVHTMCFFDDKLKNWIKENIINKVNKKHLIQLFIQVLNNSLIINDISVTKCYMMSFIDSGLIKNITLDNNIFIITTLDDREIRFTKILVTKEEINDYLQKCHIYSYNLLKSMGEHSSFANSVTILDKNLFNETLYHTFLVYDNVVNDMARNILMSYEDYMYLFEPNIILDINGKTLLDNIDKLNKEDEDFRNSDHFEILKYAMYKQMNSKR